MPTKAKFASDTKVTVERSRAEIETTLKKYGAASFGYGWQDTAAIIVFEFKSRRMKFTLTLPSEKDVATTRTHRSRQETAEIETRRRWRSLLLSIKAKLIAVDDGISSVETEFMGHIVLPNGMTVGEWMHPQIESAYRDGKMPPLLGPGTGGISE